MPIQTINTKLNVLLKSIGFVAMYVLLGAILSQLKPLFPDSFERYAQGILGTIAVLITVYVFLRIEKKSLKDYGLNWEKSSLKKFWIGLALGVGIAAVLMLVQINFSHLVLTWNEDVNILSFLLWSMAFIPLAFMEEVAFRSYPQLQLTKAFGFRTAQYVLSLLFALYHIAMMWDVKIAFLGPGVWALLYALTAYKFNGIAVPTGLHFGLNFVQSVVGGQEGITPLFDVNYPEGINVSAIKANETFGVVIQLVVLVLCVLATEYFLRKKKSKDLEK